MQRKPMVAIADLRSSTAVMRRTECQRFGITVSGHRLLPVRLDGWMLTKGRSLPDISQRTQINLLVSRIIREACPLVRPRYRIRHALHFHELECFRGIEVSLQHETATSGERRAHGLRKIT